MGGRLGGAWGGELVDEGGVLKRVEETTGALGDGERGGEEMERGGELGMDDLIMREVMLEEERSGGEREGTNGSAGRNGGKYKSLWMRQSVNCVVAPYHQMSGNDHSSPPQLSRIPLSPSLPPSRFLSPSPFPTFSPASPSHPHSSHILSTLPLASTYTLIQNKNRKIVRF